MIRTVVYSLVFFISVAEVNSYDFKKHCNTSSNPLKITSDGSISLSYSTDSPITTSCTVSVYNPDHLNQTARVMAYFTSFDVDCKRSRMAIYDDKGTESAKALTGLNDTCGSSNTIYYESTQKYMTFKFDDSNLSRSRFTIILTSFHTGKCLYNEFNCTNGFCIHDDLICNGYSNCENDVDELACVVVAFALVTIVIIVVVVAFVAMAVAIWISISVRSSDNSDDSKTETQPDEDGEKKEEEQKSGNDSDDEEIEEEPQREGLITILPLMLFSFLMGVFCYTGPEFVTSIAPPFKIKVEDTVFFGLLALFTACLLLPRTVAKKSQSADKRLIFDWELLKSIGLIFQSLVLFSIALMNISLAFFLAVFIVPVTVIAQPTTKRILGWAQKILLLLLCPAIQVFIASVITTMEERYKGSWDLFDKSWMNMKHGLLLTIIDRYLFGSWMYGLFCFAILPTWLLFWTIIHCDVRTKV